VKMAFYLEPVDADTGALRLVPGSHLEPLHSELCCKNTHSLSETHQSLQLIDWINE
jgi:ectoine hydroxylase-related dioxygenase (phytanoyl-CoA dioxygenase family)